MKELKDLVRGDTVELVEVRSPARKGPICDLTIERVSPSGRYIYTDNGVTWCRITGHRSSLPYDYKIKPKETKVEKLDFESYSANALAFAIYPNKGNNITYTTLGLAGEAGEVAEKVKKMIRDDGGVLTDSFKKEVLKELGDLQWYILTTAYEIGYTLQDVARVNIHKLTSRAARGKLGGSGDNR